MTTPRSRHGEAPVPVDPARLVTAHYHARTFYHDHLTRAGGPQSYLTQRGFATLHTGVGPWGSPADGPWRVGYAPPGPTALLDYLVRHGYTHNELLTAGLVVGSRSGRLVDTFRDRIMFPIHNPDGQTVGFIGRAAPGAGPHVPRYLNTADTPIFHKGQTLYGVAEQADRLAARWAPVIVEGPLDVIAIWLAHPQTAGLGRVALAACGTALSTLHSEALIAMPGAATHGITTAFDNDHAGRRATERAWRLMPVTGIDLHAASLPDGADPADLVTRPAELRAALTHQARPLVQVVIDQRLRRLVDRHPDLLQHIDSRVGAAAALAELLTDLDAEQILSLAGYIAERTGVGIDTVANAVIDNLEHQPRPNSTKPDARATSPPAAITDMGPAPDRRPRRGRPFLPPFVARGTAMPAGSHPVPGVTARPGRRR